MQDKEKSNSGGTSRSQSRTVIKKMPSRLDDFKENSTSSSDVHNKNTDSDLSHISVKSNATSKAIPATSDSSHIVRKKPLPFKITNNKRQKTVFDFNFDESQTKESQSEEGDSINFRKVELFKQQKKKVNNAFNISFEESVQSFSPVSSQKSEDPSLADPLSHTSDETLSQDKPKKPSLFQNQRAPKNDAFNVSFEESVQLSTPETLQRSHESVVFDVLTQNSNETLSQDEIRKSKLFQDQKMHVHDMFDVSFEESGQKLTPDAVEGNQKSEDSEKLYETLSQERQLQKPNLFGNQKRPVTDAFDVSFEESGQKLTPDEVKQFQTCETLSQDVTSNFKKPKLFNTQKLQKDNAFDISMEESIQKLTAEDAVISQQSQTSEVLSQDDVSHVQRPKLFKEKTGHVDGPFNVEPSQNLTQESNATLSQPENTSVFKKPKLFRDTGKDVKNAFDVDFEESRSLILTPDTPTLPKATTAPFAVSEQKEPDEGSFDFNFEETSATNDLNTPAALAGSESPVVRKLRKSNETDETSLSEPRDGSPSTVPRSVSSTSCNSIRNDSATSGIDKKSIIAEATERSISIMSAHNRNSILSPTLNTSHVNIMDMSDRLNESSFNDENLNQWMSDQSEDEPQPDEDVPRVSSIIRTPTREVVPASHNVTSDADLENRFHLKLQSIIENARKNKAPITCPVASHPDRKPPKREGVEGRPKRETHKPRLKKPAPFATKRLYDHIVKAIKPKYGIDAVLRAEDIVMTISETVKLVRRRKNYQKKLINDLKVEMAKDGLVETTFDFYQFVRNFLPYDFREKVVPCIQPGTNVVFPPKDAKNPFDKIL